MDSVTNETTLTRPQLDALVRAYRRIHAISQQPSARRRDTAMPSAVQQRPQRKQNEGEL